jgi:DNA-binding Xre family transcriptional regulator
MLILDITPIIKARGIEKPYTYLVKAGFTRHASTSILNSKTSVFRLDHIEKICLILNCEPNDILVWKPDPNVKYAENNSLNILLQKETNETWKETASKLTYKQLKETTSNLNKKEN